MISEQDRLPIPARTQTPGASWYGWWVGTVIDDADPEKRGRLRIRVPHTYGAPDEDEKIEDNELPWALPCFPAAGVDGSGALHIPPVGAAVFVAFLGGDHDDPVYMGGWYTEEDTPSELASSYSPGPKTLLVKTTHGHLMEMRWKEGESEVRIETQQGIKLRLIDDTAIGGLKAILTTPGGYEVSIDEPNKRALVKTPLRELLLDDTTQRAHVKSPTREMVLYDDIQLAHIKSPTREMVLDDALQTARLKTPSQLVELNDPTQTINIITPGNVNVQAGINALVQAGGTATVQAAGLATLQGQGVNVTSTGTAPSASIGGGISTQTFQGAATWAALSVSLATLTALASLVMTAAGVVTLTGITIALISSGLISLGVFGVKYKLVDQRFFAAYNAHTHPISVPSTPFAGSTSAPTQQVTPGAIPPNIDQNFVQTNFVEAN